MKTPDIYEFKCHRSFFSQLLIDNANTRGFSERNLARKLKWPASLISDIKSSRKRLSIERAIQLAKLLKLDEEKTEYLIFLVLQESGSPELGTFARRFLENNHDITYRDEGAKEVQHNQELMALLEYIHFAKALPSQDDFNQMLGRPVLDVRSACKYLEKIGAIKQSSKGLQTLKDVNLYDTVPGENLELTIRNHHAAFASAYKAYLERGADQPRALVSGYLKLTTTEIKNLQRRMRALKNSLPNFEKRSLEAGTNDLRLYQIELLAFPLTPELGMLPQREQKRKS